MHTYTGSYRTHSFMSIYIKVYLIYTLSEYVKGFVFIPYLVPERLEGKPVNILL